MKRYWSYIPSSLWSLQGIDHSMYMYIIHTVYKSLLCTVISFNYSTDWLIMIIVLNVHITYVSSIIVHVHTGELLECSLGEGYVGNFAKVSQLDPSWLRL